MGRMAYAPASGAPWRPSTQDLYGEHAYDGVPAAEGAEGAETVPAA